jgi:hypothetical protein
MMISGWHQTWTTFQSFENKSHVTVLKFCSHYLSDVTWIALRTPSRRWIGSRDFPRQWSRDFQFRDRLLNRSVLGLSVKDQGRWSWSAQKIASNFMENARGFGMDIKCVIWNLVHMVTNKFIDRNEAEIMLKDGNFSQQNLADRFLNMFPRRHRDFSGWSRCIIRNYPFKIGHFCVSNWMPIWFILVIQIGLSLFRFIIVSELQLRAFAPLTLDLPRKSMIWETSYNPAGLSTDVLTRASQGWVRCIVHKAWQAR